MEFINCDFCGSSETDILVAQKDIFHRRALDSQEFYLTKCRQCSLIYLNPRPSAVELSYYYPDDYSFHSKPNPIIKRLRTIITILISNPYLNRFLALLSYFPPINNYFNNLVRPMVTDPLRSLKPCKFLDVGCGNGLNTNIWGHNSSLYALKKRGFDAYGLESSEKARMIAKTHGLNVVGSFDDLKSQLFDYIRMNWSLEHVDSPTRFFKIFRNILKPKGKLLIAVPNYDGILYRLFPDCVEVPLHTYHFTPETLEAYFKKFRFKVLSNITFSYPAMFTYTSAFYEKIPPLNLTPLETIYFQKILNKFDEKMLGNDMVYLCEKID